MRPSVRYLVYWRMRRDELCDPNLCEHDEGTCPRELLDAAQHSEAGQLIRRALDLKALIRAGITLTLDDIAADEMYAILITEEEQARFDNEKAEKESQGR